MYKLSLKLENQNLYYRMLSRKQNVKHEYFANFWVLSKMSQIWLMNGISGRKKIVRSRQSAYFDEKKQKNKKQRDRVDRHYAKINERSTIVLQYTKTVKPLITFFLLREIQIKRILF